MRAGKWLAIGLNNREDMPLINRKKGSCSRHKVEGAIGTLNALETGQLAFASAAIDRRADRRRWLPHGRYKLAL